MINIEKSTLDRTLVAIDIAKKYNTVLVQSVTSVNFCNFGLGGK